MVAKRSGKRAPARLVQVGQPPFPDGVCDPRLTPSTRLVYERVRQLILEAERRRREHGWSWSEVAYLTGIAESTLRNVRRGVTWPDVRTFILLSDLFSIHELLPPTPPEPGDDADTPHAFAAAAALSHTDREVLEALGLDAPAGPAAIADALLFRAMELLAGSGPREMEACVRCDLIYRYERSWLHAKCELHDGDPPEGGWWRLIEDAWAEKVRSKIAYSVQGREQAARIRPLWERMDAQRKQLDWATGDMEEDLDRDPLDAPER